MMNETNTQPTTETPPEVTQAPVADSGLEKVNRSDIDTLFQHLGYAEATAWTPARLAKKIRTIEPILEKDPAFVAYRDKLNQESRDLYEKLKKMVASEDGAIDVVDDRAGATNGKKVKAPKAAPKAAKRPGTPPRREGKRDAFGCMVGTRNSNGIGVLTKDTPLKMAEIMEKAGIDDTVYNLLNDQVVKGNVQKTDKGYKLTAAGQKLIDKHNALETPAASQTTETVAESSAAA